MESDQLVQFPTIGMSPAVWGPIFWSTMHIASVGYPDDPTQEEMRAAIQFYESLQHMIPCPICKAHYKMIMERTPVATAVSSKQSLIRWVYTIHNGVNEQLGKQALPFKEYILKMNALSRMDSFSIPPFAWSNEVLAILFVTGLVVGSIGATIAFSRGQK